MKRAGLTALLSLAGLMIMGCERQDAQVSTYDPKYDGITPNLLSKPVDTAILEDQKQIARNATPPAPPAAPAPAVTTETAPAETAPAAPAPAAPVAPAAPASPGV